MIKKTFLLITIVSLVMTSCKDANKAADENEVAVGAEDTPIKLYVLDGGTVKVNNLSLFSQGDRYKGESRTFADAMYLIEHPEGRILWDAGLTESLVGQEPYTTPDGAFTVSRNDSIVDQLKQINLTPADIDYIIFSHTHFDHTGSASQFVDATWLVQEKEHDFVTSEETQKNDPDSYNAIKDLSNVKKINGDHDIFGDGKVIIKFTPGHTAGHQSLFLDLQETGPVLLSGDLYHFEENRTDRVVPSFNYSLEETLNSMEAFEAFAKERNAKVYIQHSTKDFNSMAKFPEAIK